MISYELAKKLKDAGLKSPGFQENVTSWISNEHWDAYFKSVRNGEIFTQRIFPGYCVTPEHVYIPTLSELIEECFKLDTQLSFVCTRKDTKDNRFYVVFNTKDEHGNYLDFWMPDLESIFALEWLELNKKL